MSLRKRIFNAIIVVLFSTVSAFSQNPQALSFPGHANRVSFITGQVVISDGTKVSESVEIQIVCRERVRADLYTDTLGNFNFDLARLEGVFGPQPADASLTSPLLNTGSEWDGCSVRAALAGFSSESVEFSHRLREVGVADLGQIRIHPVNQGAKTSLSVSSMLAPKSARKAMDKGLNLEEQKKWPQAEQSFRKAIGIYPEYAAAWSELGRMQYVQQNFSSAHESFQRSVEIDPKYIRPYLGLIQLATDAHDWPELIQLSNQALLLDSVSYPAVWLLNATGQYNLHNYDAAEISVRNGNRADAEHRIKGFQTLWTQILSARNAGTAFAGQSPRVRFGANRRVWENNDPSSVWLR